MTVTNRKMFKRDARDKVRQMGGIMASSEPLMQEVARFQPGGSVFSPQAGDKMLGVTLGGIGGRATEGTQMTPSAFRNLINDPNSKEIEERLLSEFESTVSRQKLNNILEKADILGLRSDRNIANFSDVFNFVQEVNPNFKFTKDMFNKLYGQDADASTRGEFLTRVLSGVGLAVPGVVDVGKGIADFLSGYPTDTIKKFLMGSNVKGGLSLPEGVDATQLALELSRRGVSEEEIKDISGFDIRALTATAAKSAKGLAGLALEAPGITVKDPEGLMASERAGQPPLSMPAETVRRIENKGIRAEEDALMQSRNILDPQTSLGTDIQAVLEAARIRRGDPLTRNQAQFEQIGADPDVEQRAKIEQAIADAAKVKGDPLTEAQATEEKREAFPDPLTAEQKAELDKKNKELNAEGEEEASKESEEAINTKDFSKVRDSYGNLGKTYSDPNNPVDNPRLRRLIKEFTDNAPKYEGLDSGLALAKIGFMMAAGESPNAIVNIANALNKGADMFLEDDKKRKEFKRQVDFAGLQYGIGEISKLRQEDRLAAREGRKPVFFVAKGPIEVDGVKYNAGDTVKLTMAYLQNNPLPKNIDLPEMAKAAINAEATLKKAAAAALAKKTINADQFATYQEKLTAAKTAFVSANSLRAILEANIIRNADGEITGIGPAFSTLIDKAGNAAKVDFGGSNTKQKYDSEMRRVSNELLQDLLGEGSKNVSNIDRTLADEIVGLKSGLMGNVFDDEEVLNDKLQNVLRVLEGKEKGALDVFKGYLMSTPGEYLADKTPVYDAIQTFIPGVAKSQLIQGQVKSPFDIVKGDDGVFRRVVK